MSSLFSRAARFARSPQGKRLLRQAAQYARSPEGRRQIDGAKARLTAARAKKRRPPPR